MRKPVVALRQGLAFGVKSLNSAGNEKPKRLSVEREDKMNLRLSALCMAAFASMPVAHAQTATDFYQGKTIQVIVGNPTGTGFDLYARALAQYMPKYIPGKPGFVVQNMPGAASLKGLQYISMTAARDGTVIGTFNSNLVNLSVLEPKTTETVDFDKLNWLGNMSSDTKVCFSWSASGVAKPEDLRTKELILGATSKGSGDIYGSILRTLYGDKVRIVLGYSTNADVWLAFEKGEASGNCTGWGVMPIRKPDWIRDGKINVLVQFTKTASPQLPNVPLIYDLPMSDEMRDAVTFITQTDAITRPFVAPPGVPADRMAILRKAFAETMKDDEFLAFAKKTELDIAYMDAETLGKAVGDIRRTPRAAVELARKLAE